jgi:hypothetical protein
MDSIVSYLSAINISLVAANDSDDELVDAGTQKPAAKGRKMYRSKKMTHCKVSETSSGTFVFRSNCEASMKKQLFRGNCQASMKKQLCRHPQVAIHKLGHVEKARCNCEASADEWCCHVACLLYLIEDLSFGAAPKISTACTSKPQSWGKGATRNRDPQPVHQNW